MCWLVPWQQQCWRLTPGGVSWCPLCIRDSGVCSLRRFLPCSWDSTEATMLCYRLGHACLPLGLDPAHHSLIQRSHSPEQCSSLHTPAAPPSRIIPPQRQHGNIGGPARARMEPTHETGRHCLPGSEFPMWLRCFGHAGLHQSRSPVCLLPLVPHIHTSPPVL